MYLREIGVILSTRHVEIFNCVPTGQHSKHVPPVLREASGGIPSLRIARHVPPMPGNQLLRAEFVLYFRVIPTCDLP